MKNFVKALIPILILAGGICFLSACGAAEKEALTKQVSEIQDKTKSLEQAVNERDARIKNLEVERKDLLDRIPESHVVAPGESHWQIASDFLTAKKNVPAEKVGLLLAETDLIDKILVGNRIGNYYADDMFGTFVTKGEAAVSPGQLRRSEIKTRDDNRAEEIARLQGKIGELERRNAAGEEKTSKLQETWASRENNLEDRTKGLETDLSKFRARSAEMETKLNSVYYLVGARDQLKASGIIKGTFLGICGDRIVNVTFANFQKELDLRAGNVIALAAGDVGLSKIKDVRLFPRDLQEDVDYRIEKAADGTSAQLHLLNKDKFILARVIIVLE